MADMFSLGPALWLSQMLKRLYVQPLPYFLTFPVLYQLLYLREPVARRRWLSLALTQRVITLRWHLLCGQPLPLGVIVGFKRRERKRKTVRLIDLVLPNLISHMQSHNTLRGVVPFWKVSKLWILLCFTSWIHINSHCDVQFLKEGTYY